MRLVAEADSRIPLAFDPAYQFNATSIDKRLEYYASYGDDDFFEVALEGETIVGFHAIRIIPYPPSFRAGNISTLWVAPSARATGIARHLKQLGEAWARKSGLIFLQTNVHVRNQRMLEINQDAGYETDYFHMRKRL